MNLNIQGLDAPLSAVYAGVVPHVSAGAHVDRLVAPLVFGVAINIVVALLAEGRPVVVQGDKSGQNGTIVKVLKLRIALRAPALRAKCRISLRTYVEAMVMTSAQTTSAQRR